MSTENSDDYLPPILEQIRKKHELGNGTWVQYRHGQNPVFRLGETHILKLVPLAIADDLAKEKEALSQSFVDLNCEVPNLKFFDKLQGWQYLIESKVDGILLKNLEGNLETEEKLDIAFRVGQMIATLHGTSFSDHFKQAYGFQTILDSKRERWKKQNEGKLKDSLILDFDQYLGIPIEKKPRSFKPVFLHGDLAPENILVTKGDGGWEVSGIIDFGNAMAGDPLFDFTAFGVLFGKGDPSVLSEMLKGYGWISSAENEQIRKRLMIYTILHPLADLKECLELIPETLEMSSWGEIEERFWPI